MPVEAKPLFRPEVIRGYLRDFQLPAGLAGIEDRLAHWSDRLRTPNGLQLKEGEILDEFMRLLFVDILGYTGAEQSPYTLSRQHVVEGFGTADAVLGDFGPDRRNRVIVFEGKGPADPLDRPYKGRRLSAVQQAYQYAINLPCDWLVVSSMRETRLYCKGADQRTYERFRLEDLSRPPQLKKLVFLLGAERCVPQTGRCHLYRLLEESERADRAVTDQYYQRYTEIRFEAFQLLRQRNGEADPKEVLRLTQKLLDRVLFCAFCEDRGLLPRDTLRDAYSSHNPYAPNPVWDNFKGLFRYIDQGSQNLDIPAYDGGLFAHDPRIDRLDVPDQVCALFRQLGEYDYRAEINGDIEAGGRQVDVEILGHIFEQSIEDLERFYRDLDQSPDGLVERPEKTRRQKEGAFYTPAFITRYIVQNTLRPVLEQRFQALRKQHQEAAPRGKAAQALEDPRVYDRETLNPSQRKVLRRFWEAWQIELGSIRILDPACGSGAFLIEAFNQLFAEHQSTKGHVDDFMRQPILYDVDRRILQDNLYGVDINEEAVQICRLSLWIKTAQRGKILTSLDRTIRVGNSLIADPHVDPKAFDWTGAFPEVDEAGGFDIVLGNPPYVRQELLKPFKRCLKERYSVYHGMADLYVYFFERGFRLLKPGGRLGLVVTNKWLRAKYAEKLRGFLANETALQSVVDLGHAKQVFVDADVFPSVLVTARGPLSEGSGSDLTGCCIPRDQLRIDDLEEQVRHRGHHLNRIELGSDPWIVESSDTHQLILKIRAAGVSLREFCGTTPQYGIKTGLNEAFLIDQAKRDQLVKRDPKASRLIRPCVRGQDLGRWACQWAQYWMIALESSADRDWPWSASESPWNAFQQLYPSLAEHFGSLERALRKRQDQGTHWWELRTCSYWDAFEHPKILYQVIQYHPRFGFDDQGLLSNDKTFFIPSSDLYLLGVLNSPLMWWHNWRTFLHLKDEALSPAAYMVEKLPIAEPSDRIREEVETRVRSLIDLTRTRAEMRHRILDWLLSEFSMEKPGSVLSEPDKLDRDAFVEAVRARLGRKARLSSADLGILRKEYDETIAPQRLQDKTRHRLEHEVADWVNQAYELTPDDISLMWNTAPPRMPASAKS